MTTTRWVLLALILFAAGIFALPQNQAAAGDDDFYGQGHRHHHRPRVAGACATDFWGRCMHVAQNRHAYRWRYYNHSRPRWRGHRHHGHGHVIVPGAGERIDNGLLCQARRRVVGEERPSKAKAQRASDNAWMGAVRYDHGERFQDLNNAKDVRHNCDPSSTTTILKRVFFRCVIEATPCRASPGASVERSQRNYEEETDEDDK